MKNESLLLEVEKLMNQSGVKSVSVCFHKTTRRYAASMRGRDGKTLSFESPVLTDAVGKLMSAMKEVPS
jgi:hypothetical protein